MNAAVSMDLSAATGDYPFANTDACRMLAAAVVVVEKDKGWSQRHVAKLLGYKSSVVVSHMATGRAPIPLDRALDFARLLKMPSSDFLYAVLNQRHPEIDWTRHLASVSKRSPVKSDSYVLSDLEALADRDLDSLPQPVVNVLRDVVADRNASRRWMQLHEVPVVEAIRKRFPDGMSPAQRKQLDECLASM